MKTTTNGVDGYVRSGHVKPMDGVHEGLTFKYRMMLPEQVELLADAVDKKDGKQAVILISAAIANQLTEWSEVDRATPPKPVPVTAAAVKNLPRPLLYALRDIVQGSRASDDIPDASPEETDEWLRGVFHEAEGKSGGQSVQREDLKNSSAASG